MRLVSSTCTLLNYLFCNDLADTMAKSNWYLSATFLLVFLSLGLSQSLPKVDLGYQIHQAISYNVSTSPFSLRP